VTAGLYSFNINESYFGLQAARREADLGEFFWSMLEPKLPGSLPAKLELIDYKKAFQMNQVGSASSLGVMLTLLIFTLISLIIITLREKR